MATEIIFVRHGETASNRLTLLHGRTDIPLTERGLRQAERVAERVVDFQPIAAVYASPLSRARRTAEIVAEALGLKPRIHPGLTEFDFGDLEGCPFSEFAARYPDLYQRAMDPNDLDVAFPNGDSLRGFHERIRSAIAEILAAHPERRVVVVAHLGVIGTSLALLTGHRPSDWTRFQVRNCAITHVAVNGASEATLHCWDDVAHLAALEEE